MRIVHWGPKGGKEVYHNEAFFFRSMKIPNVALIGVSGYANHHYEEAFQWHQDGRLRLVAATVVNQDQEAGKVEALRKISCNVFCNYKEMLSSLDGALDLCVIPTGIHLHSEMAQAAIACGCHVLLEKPVAPTIQEVNAIAAAAERAGRVVAIGYQHMYTPEIAAMKRAAVAGLLGEIKCIKCYGIWPRAYSYYARNNWGGRLSVEGKWVLDSPFGNAFAHWLNLLCFFAGSSFEASATPKSIRSELYRTYPIESPDTACMNIQTEEGIPLYLWVTHSCSDGFNPVLEIRGSKNSLIWTSEKVVFRNAGGELTVLPTSTYPQSKTMMYQSVIDKIQGGNSFTCGIPIARNQTICSNGALECSEIQLIDKRYFRTLKTPDDYCTAIYGMSDICREAFRKEELWSELKVEWAREPGEADLRNYSYFNGVKEGAIRWANAANGVHSSAASA